MKRLLFLLFLLVSFSSFAQITTTYIPKLEAELDTAKGVYRILILNKLSNALLDSDLGKAQKYGNEALSLSKQMQNPIGESYAWFNLGKALYLQNKAQDAIPDFQSGYAMAKNAGHALLTRENLQMLAQCYVSLKQFEKACDYYKQFADVKEVMSETQKKYLDDQTRKYEEDKQKLLNEKLQVENQKTNVEKQKNIVQQKLDSNARQLVSLEERSRLDSAQLDSLILERALQKAAFEEQQSNLNKNEAELKTTQLHEARYRNSRNLLILISLAVIIVSILIYNRYLIKKRSNTKLEKQNTEIAQQKTELETTLKVLKETQEQLIANEKLAALGQLTGGIAHEMLNPLNFVNNFALFSIEYAEELKELLQSVLNENGTTPEKLEAVNELIKTIQFNLDKVNENGQRADRIVKSMLEHARIKRGEKEPMNLNSFLNTAIEDSLRDYKFKNPGFSCLIDKSFSADIATVNLIPADMRKVIDNILRNAFYSMAEKQMADKNFSPHLKITTNRENGFASIAIRDNGTGIRAADLDKIFLPFFTTKPTGLGYTGMGLSLVHDLVTKSHNGRIIALSNKGEFMELTIKLPIES